VSQAQSTTESHAGHSHAHAHHEHGENCRWDRLGMFASAACLIHCLALPLLIPVIPLLALIPHGGVHLLLIIPVIALSLLAFIPGFRRHRSLDVIALALGGVSLCSAAVIAETFFGIESLDVPLTVAGGLLLVSAHALNLRRTRRWAQACAA